MKKIWNKLGEYLSDVCDKEACWIESNIFKNKLDKEKFFHQNHQRVGNKTLMNG